MTAQYGITWHNLAQQGMVTLIRECGMSNPSLEVWLGWNGVHELTATCASNAEAQLLGWSDSPL